MKIIPAALLGIVLMSGTACSGDTPQPTKAVQAGSTSSGANGSSVTCDSLVGKPGSTWAPIVNGPGCTEGNAPLTVASFDCKDGSTLIWFGRSPAWYYGRSTEALQSSPKPVDTGDWPYGNPKYKDCG